METERQIETESDRERQTERGKKDQKETQFHINTTLLAFLFIFITWKYHAPREKQNLKFPGTVFEVAES